MMSSVFYCIRVTPLEPRGWVGTCPRRYGILFLRREGETGCPWGKRPLSMETSLVSLLQLRSIISSGVKLAPPSPQPHLCSLPPQSSTTAPPPAPGNTGCRLDSYFIFKVQSDPLWEALISSSPVPRRGSQISSHSLWESADQASAGPFILLVLLADFSSLF